MKKPTGSKFAALKIALLFSISIGAWAPSGKVSADATARPVPPLLLTEVAPDSPNKTNDAGKTVDGYEFFEIYNNSDQPVPMNGYKLLYYSSSTYATWKLDSNKSIPPRSTMVYWIKSPNLNVTLDEFNGVYGSFVTPDGFDQVVTAGFSNTGSRRLILTTPDGIEISRAEYVGIGDAADGTSISYSYPTDGTTLMRKTAIRQTPTPGKVMKDQIPDSKAPAPPAGLTATAGDREIRVSWNAAVSDIAYYRILVNGVMQDQVITGSSYTLKGLYNYTSYTVALAAVNGANQMSIPSVVKTTPVPSVKDTVVPSAPVGISAVPDAGTVTLSWTPNTEADMMAYKVYTDGKLSQTVSAATYSAVVRDLTGGQAYRFEVTAVDSSKNESVKSSAVTVVTTHEPIKQEEVGFTVPDPFPPFQEYLDTSEPGFVIPGLKQGVVPQGIDHVDEKNWTVTSGYRSNKRPSVLSFIDDATGVLVKSLNLYNTDGTPYNGHAGGVTVSQQHAWVANNRFLYQTELSDIYSQPDNANVSFSSGGFKVYNNASFATYADGTLWTGDYYYPPSYETIQMQKLVNRDGVTYGAWLTGYRLDPVTDQLPAGKNSDPTKPVIPDYILSIPNKIQGAAFYGDDILLSYTAENAYSTLMKFKNPLKEPPHAYVTIDGAQVPVWFLDSLNKEDEMVIPPYAEEIFVRNGKACLTFESGSAGFAPYMYYGLDRTACIDLAAWKAYDQITIEGAASPMLQGDAAQLKVMHSLGEQGTFDVTGQASFTSSDPSIAFVSEGGVLRAVGVGESVITARYGERQVSITLKVVPKLITIQLTAPKLPVDRGAQIPITVTGNYSDGSERDLTAQAEFRLSKPETMVYRDGVWIAMSPGRTLIQAEYQGKQSESLPVVVRAKTGE